MARTDEHKDENDTLRAQLHELNERARWYSNQIWQVPFAFLGIVALVIGAAIDKSHTVLGWAFLFVCVFGIVVFIHMLGLAYGEKRAVCNIKKIEEQLHLEQTTQYKPGVWYCFLGFVIIAILASLFLGIYLLTMCPFKYIPYF